jgi:NAD(P)-dependent dehydrogenase (short-subunit alcohol dehydrogenase family)
MTAQAPPAVAPGLGEPALAGQTAVILGGSSGIGLATAQHVRAAGGDVVLTGRDGGRLAAAAVQTQARRSAAFDVTDADALAAFFAGLEAPVDHVMVAAGGAYYAPLAEIDLARVHREVDEHLGLALAVARHAVGRVRPGGTLVFMSGTGARRPGIGLGIASAITAAMPAVTANLALEVAPIRVNLIAPGFVDTPLSARLLGDDLEARRAELRERLPIRRVVGPADIAALAVHLMTNTALTGATFDIDGGQQLLDRA